MEMSQEKILYVSDLDGTLINDSEEITFYTASIINNLVNKGMIFSYATARSNSTSSKITNKIIVDIPSITYNGAFVIDNKSGEILISNYFDTKDCFEILKVLISNEIYPIVYSHINGVEKFSYSVNKLNKGMKEFIDSRKGDSRDNPIKNLEELENGQIFYFACIDKEEKLMPTFEYLKDKYSCVYQIDSSTGEYWLEIMPVNVNKATAILQLKRLLKCDKVISFGDGRNDLSMFEISDECYAVDNAVYELKSISTSIIGSNNDNGVAEWLNNNVLV